MMRRIRAVIVEDEWNNKVVLEQSLSKYMDDVEIVGFADNVKSGIDVINSTKPDLLFLDIEIDGGTSFDILDHFVEINFSIIFVTAYDHYAIKAIKYSAFDYLLKPLDITELENAVSRYRTNGFSQKGNLDHLKNNMKEVSGEYDSLIVASARGYTVLKADNIVYLFADGNYVTFVLDDGVKHLVAQTLSYYESILSKQNFCRVHKSHIVNLRFVKEVEGGRVGRVMLDNGSVLDVAARRKKYFINRLKEYRF